MGDSFLTRLTAEALDREVVVTNDRGETVDIQFTSVQFPIATRVRHLSSAVAGRIGRVLPGSVDYRWSRINPEPKGRARTHVWFTGENVRPPSSGWDASLSFDLDPLGGLNAYLPLWWYSIGLLGPAQSMFIDPAPTIDELLAERSPVKRPTGFAVAFINHPHPMRFHAVRALSQFGRVDVFGRAVGQPIPNKATLAGQYKFMLCFENDLYPGYVTEKAIEAWGMGAIPLWWGSDPGGYLNPEAVINAAAQPSLACFAEEVAELANDEELWHRRFRHPLVLRRPDLQPALKLIRQVSTH
jgi:hypothetical protein